MEIDPGAAYSARAEEYAELFGSMSAIHPADRALIDAWADSLTGHVIDAGCGLATGRATWLGEAQP